MSLYKLTLLLSLLVACVQSESLCTQQAHHGACENHLEYMIQHCRQSCRSIVKYWNAKFIFAHRLQVPVSTSLLNATIMMMGQKQIVLDGLYTRNQSAAHYDYLLNLDYTPEYDTPEAYEANMSSGYTSDLPSDYQLIRDLVSKAAQVYPALEYFQVYRAYVNWFETHDHPYFHRDQTQGAITSPHGLIRGEATPPHVLTLLYYVNPDWDFIACGGETLFLKAGKRDVLRTIHPIQGV